MAYNINSDTKADILENENVGIREDDFDGSNQQKQNERFTSNLKYLVVGILFGIVFVKAEIVS